MVIILEDKFNNRIEKYKKDAADKKRVYDRIAYLRLLVMVGLVYFMVQIFRGSQSIQNIYGVIITLIIFIGLLIYHNSIKEKIKFEDDMILINEKYIKRINGKWIEFEDCGEEFVNKDHPYSFDLDLVGKKSLFQLINITTTYFGRQRLANTLLFPNLNKEEIEKNQEATKELSEKIDFCQKIEYAGNKKNKNKMNPDKLLNYVESDNIFINWPLLKKVIYIMPMVTIPISFIIILFKIKSLKILVYFFFIVQLLLWGIKALKLNEALQVVSCYKNTLEEYEDILSIIEKEDFQCEKLRNIKKNLFDEDTSSIKAIRKLYNISEKINLRNNGIMYLILNVLFLWDYQCIFSLESWKKQYGDKVRNWLYDIGTIEELMSISVLSHINESVIYPSFDEKKLIVRGKELGHPLISSDVRVNNDVDMEDNIFIITGSNMSGKTTLLRTIGINLVIAYSGGMICGEKLNASLMDICSSMRITDDLQGGISTFYGELIRIKNIIDRSKENNKMIFLIDEIFRGTNSKDRITGAETVLRNLNERGVIGALTTHDLELCTLSNTDRIKNYHFEEHYKDNKILFDYKLREGKSTTTNAKFLMKIVGIDI